MKLINIETEKVNNERGHSLKLTANYISNSFNDEQSKSFDEALSSPKNDSKVIGLEYSVPFGDSYHNTTVTKQEIDKQRVEYQRLSIKDKIEMEENVLVHNISKFEDSYLLAKRQVTLTKKILNEQNKLYLRGLATFDDVIRAEESYINATVEEKRVLYTFENLIIDYAFLKGSLIDIIKRYKD